MDLRRFNSKEIEDSYERRSFSHTLMWGKNRERLIIDFDDVLIPHDDGADVYLGSCYVRISGPRNDYSTGLLDSYPDWEGQEEPLLELYMRATDLPMMLQEALVREIEEFEREEYGPIAA